MNITFILTLGNYNTAGGIVGENKNLNILYLQIMNIQIHAVNDRINALQGETTITNLV